MPNNAEADLRAALADIHADCYGWALACCHREPAQAEDVLQRAYLRVLDGSAKFAGRSSLRTFVFGVIRMTAREEARSSRKLGSHAALHADLPDNMPWPDAAASSAERRNRLITALARLSTRQREVLELVFYHDMTIGEAAQIMDVRIGSARTHYERGKARLRTLLPDVMEQEWISG